MEDQALAAGADFDTGGIAAGADELGRADRNGTADAPKTNLHGDL
jgi:hypothetical protein